MKKTTLFIILSLISNLVFSQTEKNFIDQNYIEVSGKAELLITPDLIYIEINISEKDPKNKFAIDQSEKLMIEKLQGLGIDVSKELTVKDLLSNFRNGLFSKAEIILSREYELVVHDGKTAGKVLVELEKIGISNTSISRVDHSKLQDYKKDVKVNAMKAAKEKADLLAHAINQTTGRALLIIESEVPVIPSYNSFANNYNSLRSTGAVHRGAAEDFGPSLDFEKIKLEAVIVSRFELK